MEVKKPKFFCSKTKVPLFLPTVTKLPKIKLPFNKIKITKSPQTGTVRRTVEIAVHWRRQKCHGHLKDCNMSEDKIVNADS